MLYRLVGLTGAVIGLSLFFASLASAAFPGANGKIVQVGELQGAVGMQVFSRNPDGSGVVALTAADGATYAHPHYSADGGRIAYVRNGDIWVMDADGSARHQITSGGGSDEPAWSPDGQTIFFASTAHSADREIYKISADGAGTDAPAYSGVFDDAPAISPDGTQILVRSFDNNTPGDLWSIPVGTTAFTQLTSTGGEDEDHGNWSPDGTRIVYDSDPNGNRDIFTIGWPSPGTRTPLAATSASDTNPAYSPDGSKVVYQSGDQIMVMNASDGGSKTVVRSSNVISATQPDWGVPGGGHVNYGTVIHGTAGTKQSWQLPFQAKHVYTFSEPTSCFGPSGCNVENLTGHVDWGDGSSSVISASAIRCTMQPPPSLMPGPAPSAIMRCAATASHLYTTPGSYAVTLHVEPIALTVDNTAVIGAAPFYVALGDSFQSGEGADGSDPQNYHPANGVIYEPGTGGDDGCHRSPDAYPRLLQTALRVTTAFWACSGARIADIDGGTGERGTQSVKSGEDPQIQHLNSLTRLVTVGIGGNDIHFKDIVQNCVLQTFHAPGKCEGQTDELNTLLPTVANRLLHLYQKIAVAAPNARILVVDYPMIFPETGDAGGDQCEHLNHEDQLWANDLVNHLDDWIAEAVRESGVAELVDVRNAFQRHGLCSTDPYANHIWLTLFGVKPESFHPNAEGQASFFRLVLAQYKRGAGATTRVRVPQGRTTTKVVRVPRGTGAITFSSRWPGSSVAMTLVSPHGQRYSPSTKGIRHAAGRTFETYIINHPEAGRWKVRLYGTHVREGGEPVALTATRARTPPAVRVRIQGRPRIARGVVTLKLKCIGARYTCDGTVMLSVRERGHAVTILHTTFAAPTGRPTAIPLYLTRARLARLRRDHKAEITVSTDPSVGSRQARRSQQVSLKV